MSEAPPAGSAPQGDAQRPSLLRVVLAVFEVVFYLGYPFVVYYAHTRLETRLLGFVMIALVAVAFAIRLRGAGRELMALLKQHIGIVVIIGLAVVLDDRVYLLFLPVVMSLYLLFTFGSTLFRPPSMIERFARMMEDDLPPFTHPYCRKVTIVWCAFFLANAIGVALLAVYAPLSWWAVYNGIIFYVLLGILILGESVLHKIWFRYYGTSAFDVVLSRLFPAERTARGRRSLAYLADREIG